MKDVSNEETTQTYILFAFMFTQVILNYRSILQNHNTNVRNKTNSNYLNNLQP